MVLHGCVVFYRSEQEAAPEGVLERITLARPVAGINCNAASRTHRRNITGKKQKCRIIQETEKKKRPIELNKSIEFGKEWCTRVKLDLEALDCLDFQLMLLSD